MSSLGKIDILRNDLKINGYISFNISDLIESGILDDNFIEELKSDRGCYVKDMDEIKPRLQSLRADFRTSDNKDVLITLLKKFNVHKAELENNGFDESFDVENSLWKYSVNHSFEYYSGIHDDLVNAILSLNNCEIDQMWWYYQEDLQESNIFPSTLKLYKTLSKTFYPEASEKLDYNFHTTFYNKGCGITDHEDGVNPNSLYAALFYLNNRYDVSWGGRLRIGNNNEIKKLIEPTFGTITLLDFTKFNPTHGVEFVTNTNGRFAYLSFVGKLR